ncbi:MAG TPA: haloacid dehalogenase type II [Roseiarcus sp.]|nr:haloacid dehalogenase type II [Roseiarcus sp.]
MSNRPEPLEGVTACVFDAYGTLFDFSSVAQAARQALGERAAALVALWRDKQLQMTWLLAAQGRHRDFWAVTGEALDFAFEAFGVRDRGLRDRLLARCLALDVFPEAPEALRRLKARGLRLAILSNGTPAMLEAVVGHAGLGGYFEAVISVEEAGVFKPHPRVYQSALDRLRLPREAISFQSSNGWDAYAASAFGMKVVWCNRSGQPPERLPGRPDRVVASLAELEKIVVG